MKDIRQIEITLDNPNWRQKVVLYFANMMLSVATRRFKDDEERFEKEVTWIFTEAYHLLNRYHK